MLIREPSGRSAPKVADAFQFGAVGSCGETSSDANSGPMLRGVSSQLLAGGRSPLNEGGLAIIAASTASIDVGFSGRRGNTAGRLPWNGDTPSGRMRRFSAKGGRD